MNQEKAPGIIGHNPVIIAMIDAIVIVTNTNAIIIFAQNGNYLKLSK
jgi:hypothetical protein